MPTDVPVEPAVAVSTPTSFPPDAPPPELSGWLWLPYLFFRPRKFFQYFGTTTPWLITGLCVFVGGLAFAQTWISDVPPRPDISMAEQIGYRHGQLVGGAIIFGPIIYAIYGLWYGLRIRFCRPGESWSWKLSYKVLIYSSQVAFISGLVYSLLLKHVVPASWISHTPAACAFALLLLIYLWSAWVSYIGVRTCFSVGRISSKVWFLVLPWTLYLVGTLGVLWVTDSIGTPRPPSPREFHGEHFTFSHPADWKPEEGDSPLTGTPFVGFLDPHSGALLVVTLVNDTLEAERVFEDGLNGLEIDPDEFGRFTTVERWGPYRGRGDLRHLTIADYPMRLLTFRFSLPNGATAAVIEGYPLENADVAEPGLKLIRYSLQIHVPPDIRKQLPSPPSVR